MFPSSAICVVVGRISVDKPIKHKSVEGESPVRRRRLVCYVCVSKDDLEDIVMRSLLWFDHWPE